MYSTVEVHSMRRWLQAWGAVACVAADTTSPDGHSLASPHRSSPEQRVELEEHPLKQKRRRSVGRRIRSVTTRQESKAELHGEGFGNRPHLIFLSLDFRDKWFNLQCLLSVCLLFSSHCNSIIPYFLYRKKDVTVQQKKCYFPIINPQNCLLFNPDLNWDNFGWHGTGVAT